MSLDLSSLILVVTLGAPVLLVIMLLPTILELRKPTDLGPRLIMPADGDVALSKKVVLVLLVDVEEHQELNIGLVFALVDVISVLTNVEV